MDDVLIRFRLIGDEARALRVLSARELRTPCGQVRFMLRQELEHRGFLSAPETLPDDHTPPPPDTMVIPVNEVIRCGRMLLTRTPDGRCLLHVETRHAGGAWLELTAEDVAWLREVLK